MRIRAHEAEAVILPADVLLAAEVDHGAVTGRTDDEGELMVETVQDVGSYQGKGPYSMRYI